MRDPIDDAVLTLAALVTAVDGRPDTARPDICQAAIRRQGMKLADIGGPRAMQTAVMRVLDLSPVRREERYAIITAAWSGLPVWGA